MSFPEEYYLFFQKFNEGEYYECHDLLEEIWMGQKQNKYLQGMLQMTVGIYHFEYGNIKGARLMLESGKQYLLPYRPFYWGVNVDEVIQFIDQCLSVLPEKDSISLEEVKKIPFPAIQLQLQEEPLS
ncbi:DUF309 domain-containing protein [Microaerobacter geothermalis]|uniref:DUF309 domain-containing protein n=1 Tax=Microaerobacter geothermalis TaxID=674972 RepID=UPI001F15F2A5|nr:DUF309 domain-containing protein [Microaerobacter geothermalis]MCF6092467.1 DUF309 domain-containing protein [Microaerobacter geothermalis]